MNDNNGTLVLFLSAIGVALLVCAVGSYGEMESAKMSIRATIELGKLKRAEEDQLQRCPSGPLHYDLPSDWWK